MADSVATAQLQDLLFNPDLWLLFVYEVSLCIPVHVFPLGSQVFSHLPKTCQEVGCLL